MANIAFGKPLFDRLTADAKKSPRQRAHVNFHPSPDFPAHRFMIAMEPGTYVRPHRHLEPKKDETLVVLRGRLGLLIFDEQGNVTETAVLGPGCDLAGADIPMGTIHSTVALESGSVVMEAKAGPYNAATDKDFMPWAPAEGDPRAEEFRAGMARRFT